MSMITFSCFGRTYTQEFDFNRHSNHLAISRDQVIGFLHEVDWFNVDNEWLDEFERLSWIKASRETPLKCPACHESQPKQEWPKVVIRGGSDSDYEAKLGKDWLGEVKLLICPNCNTVKALFICR